MSLTRDEWAQMWDAIKVIQYNAPAVIKPEIEFIKQKIQKVIGQME
jgi:hypothetical protein